jgi:hypothetical protein
MTEKSYNIGAFELLTSQPLVEGDNTTVENLCGLYRLSSVDNAITYSFEGSDSWDPTLSGGVVAPGDSRLLWCRRGTKLTYYATTSRSASARLEKLRAVPDDEVARGGD